MAKDLEDYFNIVYEEQHAIQPSADEMYLITRATRMLDKRREITEVDKQLKGHIKEFEMKRKTLLIRRDDVLMKEESLKESLLHFDRFLKENDAKRNRSLKKAGKERQIVLQKEAEADELKEQCLALENSLKKLQHRVQRNTLYWTFLEQVLKMAKFEEVWQLLGRFETLRVTRDQLRQRQREVQEQTDNQRAVLQRYTGQQSCLLLQKNNLLSQLQTQLDQTRLEALRWENKLNHIQNTAAKETLLLGQIKMVTLNLYQMTGGHIGEKESVTVDDTETQLDKIQMFIQNQSGIVNDINHPPSNLGSQVK